MLFLHKTHKVVGAREDDFEAAYRDLFPRVARVAFRLLGDRSAAEDVAAETLARAYAHWSRIGSAGRCGRWPPGPTTRRPR